MESEVKFIEDGNIVNIVDIPNGMIKEKITPAVYRPIETNTGFFLERIQDKFEEVQLFGEESRRREQKSIKRFHQLDTSMGILYSGFKGTGKSQTVKNVANNFIEDGMPCIIIDNSVSKSILTTLTSKLKECVFILDEFEKNFTHRQANENNNSMTQNDLLTFFDGIYSSGKFLFLLTANNENFIIDMFFDRPERIRYVFRYTKLNESEIEEYLLANDIHSKELVETLSRISLNFDLLKNIVQELKFGEDIEHILADLGITREYTLYITKCEMEIDNETVDVNMLHPTTVYEFDPNDFEFFTSVDPNVLRESEVSSETFELKYLNDTDVEFFSELTINKNGPKTAKIKYTGFVTENKKLV